MGWNHQLVLVSVFWWWMFLHPFQQKVNEYSTKTWYKRNIWISSLVFQPIGSHGTTVYLLTWKPIRNQPFMSHVGKYTIFLWESYVFQCFVFSMEILSSSWNFNAPYTHTAEARYWFVSQDSPGSSVSDDGTGPVGVAIIWLPRWAPNQRLLAINGGKMREICPINRVKCHL